MSRLSRRGLLGSAAALAPVATAAAAVPAAASPSPDAALVELCARHAVNFRRYNTEGGLLPYEADPLWTRYRATLDGIGAARPTTLAGIVAKARVALIEATNPDGAVHLDDGIAQVWCCDIVRDLLRLAGNAA